VHDVYCVYAYMTCIILQIIINDDDSCSDAYTAPLNAKWLTFMLCSCEDDFIYFLPRPTVIVVYSIRRTPIRLLSSRIRITDRTIGMWYICRSIYILYINIHPAIDGLWFNIDDDRFKHSSRAPSRCGKNDIQALCTRIKLILPEMTIYSKCTNKYDV